MLQRFVLFTLLAAGAVDVVQTSHAQGHAPFRGRGSLDQIDSESINNETSSLSVLSRRDDYTCAPGRPCKNGACCGKSGNCGYGPVYCGDGCSSHCDATAECGQYSKIPGKTCPLNVCCSEFGFCGTTSKFCGKTCQSNCIEHPTPPSGGGKATNRVIGYWEAWNARSKCHNTQASDLPIQALTHVNYAFAYINPSTFEITTMDAQTPVSTFQDVVKLKDLKPDLKVFVSIGGWTFSDNETATQPVFGSIARSESNRQKFADNLLKFMTGYGFDGVDLDWEYPGAPDRGGKPDDIANYVELLRTLRSSFDNSGRSLEISFTAPSSLWYLRWFDLPGLIKYADWINLMSYDLHGVWDSTNPIGSIVQAHTNLTEIKLAAELFWRVKIPPQKIALGYGFYGRAFTLADPSCTKPGCAFKGGANKGPCTGTSGYLAYYEIQDILKKNNMKRDLKVVHDQDAAVKYFSWDRDQWISYDDADTFKQKQDWANSVGFSGSLIWASDLDDYDNTAHIAFTGIKKLGSRKELEKANKYQEHVETTDSFLGQGCKFYETVVADVKSHDCGKDMELVGYDTHGCKGDKNHKDWQCGWPMCCPKKSRMKDKCMWRGSGGDCNGQCHANEVKIGGSSWGGYPGEGKTGRCSRGGKALCCQVDLEAANEGCYWTKGCDNKRCAADEESVAHAFSINGDECVIELPPLKRRGDELFSLQSRASSGGQNYCCKKTKKAFDSCKWVGKGDCAQNTCDRGEVTLATNRYGDIEDNCNWYRSKALCCKPNQDAINEPLCNTDLCQGDDCKDPDEGSLTKRSVSDSGHHLDKRVRPAAKRFLDIGAATRLVLTSAPYPNGPAGELFKGSGLSTLSIKGGFMWESNVCKAIGSSFKTVASIPVDLTTWSGKRNLWDTEHYRDIASLDKLLVTAVTGVLLSGKKIKAAKMKAEDIIKAWNAQYPAGAVLHRLGESFVTGVKGFGTPDAFGNDWNRLETPNMRFHTVLGSHAYRYPLTYIPNEMNRWKSSLLVTGRVPIDKTKFNKALVRALAETGGKAGSDAVSEILTGLQRTYATVAFYNDAYLAHYFDKAYRDFHSLADEMALYFPGWESFPAILKEFDVDMLEFGSQNAKDFMTARTGTVISKFPSKETLDLSKYPVHVQQLYNTIQFYAEQQSKLTFVQND